VQGLFLVHICEILLDFLDKFVEPLMLYWLNVKLTEEGLVSYRRLRKLSWVHKSYFVLITHKKNGGVVFSLLQPLVLRSQATILAVEGEPELTVPRIEHDSDFASIGNRVFDQRNVVFGLPKSANVTIDAIELEPVPIVERVLL
jgi:hypothetical protein